MKRLIIVGAGGFGREVLNWAKDLNKVEKRWGFYGFLDPDVHALDGFECDAEVLGKDDTYEIRENDEFVCAIGDSHVREKVMEALEKRGAVFIALIHPTAVVAETAKIGEGVVICPLSVVSANATLKRGCQININSSIGHDVFMDEFCTICPDSGLMGAVKLGKSVFVGAGVRVVPSASIGDDAYLCAGSVVMGDVGAGLKTIGNPARILPKK